METQSQIKRKLSQTESIEYVCKLLEDSEYKFLINLADEICHHFNFFNFRGIVQRSGCMKALRELEKEGHFILPKPPRKSEKKTPRRLDSPVPLPQSVPSKVGQIHDLDLLLVETEENMRIWNELMIREHPRGAGPLVGRQIRYLVKSECGYLGGFSFSSAALQLQDRDRWIGWNLEARRELLQYVVNMSRFLIRPSISCQNLATRLLGMVIRRFPKDFEARYGYDPLLLETFVDISHYSGGCYRAANWQWIGKTKGRGRQDHLNRADKTVKDIYVYPLDNDFRHKLGLPKNCGLDALEITSNIEGESWAKNEFGEAKLGDSRLSARLVNIALNKYRKPGMAYARVVDGDKSKVKGYYRLIDKPDGSAVTMSNILQPHREQTIRRMKSQSVVLCVQDGTDLNYNNLSNCKGLGFISKNQTGATSKGLHLHSMMALTTEGVPLGILHVDCTAPKQRTKGEKQRTKNMPIEEKKTYCWIEAVQDCMDIKHQIPHTSLINIMDREGDFYDNFDYHRMNCSRIDLLVRAKHDRKTDGPHQLFETAKLSEIKAHLTIKIPRQSARAKKSKQKARAKREERMAEVNLRYTQVVLNPPQHLKNKEPIKIWIVHLREESPPSGTNRLEWFLLTTLEIKSAKDAIQCVKWYCLRWRIEDWHRVLKSGCGVKKIAHKTAERLKRAIAINLVIAWRIMLMVLLGRETPELPPEVVFSDLELKVLSAYANKKKIDPPDELGKAVKIVAKLGGYLDRTCDPPPGYQIMWRGYLRLQMLCEGFLLNDG